MELLIAVRSFKISEDLPRQEIKISNLIRARQRSSLGGVGLQHDTYFSTFHEKMRAPIRHCTSAHT
jgi:hypothetical protein